jgi:predicted O-methyltransferase YrrM
MFAARARSWLRFWAPAGLLENYRKQRGDGVDAQSVAPAFRLPTRSLAELFPGIESVLVQVPTSEITRDENWELGLPELLVVGAIVAHMQPGRVFEIGTFTGSAALLAAANSPEQAEVITLDLDPSERLTYKPGADAGWFPDYRVGARFLGTPMNGRVRQLLANSQTFDFSPHEHSADVVLIDADHTYPFVKHDTAAALKIVRRGGVIIWDDYRWSAGHPECEGVTRCVEELASTRPCFQLAGTRLAVHVAED